MGHGTNTNKRVAPDLEGLVAYYAKAYAAKNWDDLDEINSLAGDTTAAMVALKNAVFGGDPARYQKAIEEAYYRSSKGVRDPQALHLRVLTAGFKSWPALDKAVVSYADFRRKTGRK
jgi:hypothetical protein